ANQPIDPDAQPWVGQNLSATADHKLLESVRPLFSRYYFQEMQARSWANIPILNEWKRRYPDQDPVEVHQRLWGARLVDPAGGQYVWNDQSQTLESTTLGSPVSPKIPDSLPGFLASILSGEFGLDFENAGLRARAALNRKP